MDNLNLITEYNLTSACITAKSFARGDDKLTRRIDRAYERLGYGQFVFDGHVLRMLSSDAKQVYRVTEGACQCIDFLMHGNVCKHQIARVLLQVCMITGRTDAEWRADIDGFKSRVEQVLPRATPGEIAAERMAELATDADFAAMTEELNNDLF